MQRKQPARATLSAKKCMLWPLRHNTTGCYKKHKLTITESLLDLFDFGMFQLQMKHANVASNQAARLQICYENMLLPFIAINITIQGRAHQRHLTAKIAHSGGGWMLTQ